MDFVVELVSGGDLLRLRISGLPRVNASQPELVERVGMNRAVLTLREGAKYRFEIEGATGLVNLEPSELFDFDDHRRLSGRIEPGEAVGVVTVAATDSSGKTFEGRLDVRSQKFSDETAFASMISDLARIAVEALHQGFAPSSGQFSPDPSAAPRLIYQQFAVLSALLQTEDLKWALGHVLSQPHRAWLVEQELRPPGRPIKGSSRLGANLAKPGPRVPNRLGSPSSLPALVPVQRTEDTLDTTPNRYVRFVLERWRSIALDVARSAETLGGAARRRGVAAAEALATQLDQLLAGTFLRTVGRLRTFPGDNPVLRRQEGYRQITAAAALVEGSLGLDLQIDDPLLVSRRSVATLYEYWCFIKLADSLFEACGRRPRATEYFRPVHNGMSLVMRAGTSTRMEFSTTIAGQPIKADLFFNKTFSGETSWTRPMRPDASVLLRRPGGHEVWLHFDAKYKVDWERPFETGSPAEEEESERLGASQRGDLLKMHAYRDAIRNSAGAYVLFPGTTPADFNLHRDELPGLGAFPLRPDRAAEDVQTLERFFRHALEHVASRGTRHHRAVYWNSVAYEGQGTTRPADPPAGVSLPPADTLVLCGYIRPGQRPWVQTNLYYNVRGDGRPGALAQGDAALDAPVLCLYGADGLPPLLFRRASAWTSWTATTLRRTGYPDPRGESYLVAKIEPLEQPAWLSAVPIEALSPRGTRRGAPFAISWLDLVLSTQES